MISKYPLLKINLNTIKENCSSIVRLCEKHGIGVAGVTKVTCAVPEVGKALLQSGCIYLADSRLENIERMRNAGIDTEYLLLRIPMISEAEEVVKLADISLNSEISVIQELDRAAAKLGKKHKIVLMIDLGDLREGVWVDNAVETAKNILTLENIEFHGIGANLACYGGVIPTEENMNILMNVKTNIEESCGIDIKVVSGGNSSGLPLVMSGNMPHGINHFRVGEAILLGRNVIDRSPFPGTKQDAFIIEAEIVELKYKPSVPIGLTGQDAFGNEPEFMDKGNHLRAICAIGRGDVIIDGLMPLDENIEILGASSDHLLLDVTDSEQNLQIGSTVEFYPNYGCLLRASTSHYVKKEIINKL